MRRISDKMDALQKGGGMAQRVGFWWRGLAAGIDVLIFLALSFLVWATVEEPLAQRMGPVRAGMLANVIAMALWLAYTLLEVYAAATAGKILLGLSIAQVNGEKAPRAVLVFRWFSKQLPWILFLFYGITFNAALYYLAGAINAMIWIGCLQMLDEDKRS